MKDEILSYIDMCMREKASLQRGMNFRPAPGHSIFLMSQRLGAPYDDLLSADGLQLEYEGHDITKAAGVDPKKVDQPRYLPTGTLTENGKFAKAIESANQDALPLVRVYEKLKDGIWSDRGLFELVSYSTPFKDSEQRMVFKFKMRLSDAEDLPLGPMVPEDFRRIIPSWVKQVVFKRDKGLCVICGESTEIHFDHDLPFAKGGTSLTPENVRILFARHNLSKGARIQ